MGWAGFGVVYYDAQWREVGSFSEEITGSKEFASPEDFYPSTQRSLTVKVPTGAVHSYFWISNDGSNTETYASDAVLTNVFVGVPIIDNTKTVGNRFTQNVNEKNVVVSGAFQRGVKLDYSSIDQYGYPVNVGRRLDNGYPTFWDYSVHPPTGFILSPTFDIYARIDEFSRPAMLFGDAAMWQSLQLTPGRTYDMSISYWGFGNIAVAAVEFYDANGNHIGNASETLDNEVPVIYDIPDVGTPYFEDRLTFTFPANARFALANIWTGGQSARIELGEFIVREKTP